MLSDEIRKNIQNIIGGSRIEGKADTLTAARNFLCTGFGTSTKIETDFERLSAIKEEQADALRDYAEANGIWLTIFPMSWVYLTEGGESKIYFSEKHQSVVKANDAVYYLTWLHFLNSLIIHNVLFEDTSYQLLGFSNESNGLMAVLQQPFVLADSPTDLVVVKDFLQYNGFQNTRRNDYYNQDLGLILEDIHDENVITNSGKLFFIDTVFYIDVR